MRGAAVINFTRLTVAQNSNSKQLSHGQSAPEPNAGNGVFNMRFLNVTPFISLLDIYYCPFIGKFSTRLFQERKRRGLLVHVTICSSNWRTGSESCRRELVKSGDLGTRFLSAKARTLLRRGRGGPVQTSSLESISFNSKVPGFNLIIIRCTCTN